MRNVECYDGHADAQAWLDSINTMATLYGWSDEVCLCVAKLRLRGMAQRWAHRKIFLTGRILKNKYAAALVRLVRQLQHA